MTRRDSDHPMDDGLPRPTWLTERCPDWCTREHAEAIKKHGVCIHHRHSFSPIERALNLLQGGGELPLPDEAEQI